MCARLLRSSATALLAFCLCPSLLDAQVAVQLPTFSQFQVQTTVVAPDRGAIGIAGNAQNSAGLNALGSFGPLQVARGRRSVSRETSIFVTIHDFSELERESIAGPPNEEPVVAAASTAGHVAGTLARARAQRAAELQALEAAEAHAAELLLARGRSAEAEGKAGVAKICYKQAAKRGGSQQRREALAALGRLKSKPADGS
jgi:hypothetical protein